MGEVVRGILARGNLKDTANIKCQKTLITEWLVMIKMEKLVKFVMKVE